MKSGSEVKLEIIVGKNGSGFEGGGAWGPFEDIGEENLEHMKNTKKRNVSGFYYVGEEGWRGREWGEREKNERKIKN